MKRLGFFLLCLSASLAPAADECVAGRVAEISRANLAAHVAALDYERSTPETQATASAYIQARFAELGYTVIIDPVQTSENLIVRKEGAEGLGRRFVVGAHFDSVTGSPGADDNATGVAALIEIARVLEGYTPNDTIEIVAYALEEFGKPGSNQHASALAEAQVDLIGMISMDMIGFTCQTPGCQTPFADVPNCIDLEPEGGTVGDFIFAGTKSGTSFMIEQFGAAAAEYVPGLAVTTASVSPLCDTQGEFNRSDHEAFWSRDMPAMVLTDSAEARNANYHQPGDTIETLDMDFVRDVTRAVTATVLQAVGGQCVPDGGGDELPPVPNLRRSDTVDGGG